MSADPPTAADTVSLGPDPFGPTILERGTCVGRYVMLDRLGQGGMGVVYRAYDPDLDRSVALKLLYGKTDSHWDARRERLLREAQALAKLQHPNVIAVHDVGTFDGDVFIAMELVDGASLQQWLRASTRSRKEILDVFLSAGEGLAAAHRAGLVHRDFKPDNVIVGKDGRVRVLDFGLARAAEGSISGVLTPAPDPSTPHMSTPHPLPDANLLATPLTRADAIVGTPRYMSPEQARGRTTDIRADQFSFCVALYQALYGSLPFASDSGKGPRAWQVEEPPEGATVPRWLRQVLLRGLAEQPADRYPSMQELLTGLRADPSARRRRWWRIAAALAAAASVAGLFAGLHRKQAQVCQGAERELAGVWDDARREQVRAAFHASGLPYADAALATVEGALDEYARSWLNMHVDACESALVRREQSQELLDLRMACLADRRTELKTISDLFASADPSVVEHAAQSAQSLPGLQSCADVAALRAPIPPPRDPHTAERVTAIREELARAEALEVAAKFDDGLKVGQAGLDEARPLGYPPILAEAQLRVGRLLGWRGDFAQSASTLHDALVNALAGRDDEAAARAATALVTAMGIRQAHYEEGARWADVAEALAGRMQNKDELLGVFFGARATLREREGKYDEALADATRALELEQRVFGPNHYAVAQAYYHLGAVHYFRAEYPEALEAYRKCLEIQGRNVGPDHPDLIGARVGMADVYGDSGDHERALSEYQGALAMLVRARPEDPDIAMIRNNLGGELQQLDRAQEAFDQYKLALDDWEKRVGLGKEAVTALSNMGEAKVAMGQPEEARRYFNQALAACGPALGPEHHACARLLWGVGETYRIEGKLKEALDDYQRSLSGTEKALGPKHPQLTGPLLGIGRVQLARHQPTLAVEALERLLAILGDDPGESLTRPDAQFALAQAFWALGEREGALDHARKARDGYAEAGAPGRKPLGEATAWLDAHH
jgi:tetratricopeptide (TPR) repeat protein/predicted Ser/Thr protein kinase